MRKDNTFFGQPLYGQLINLLDKSKILQLSRQHNGERYIKRFDGWHHVVVMLYAILMRFDSLCENTAAMLSNARKLHHLGITSMPYRTTLSDANKRRHAAFFESVYSICMLNTNIFFLSDSNKIV